MAVKNDHLQVVNLLLSKGAKADEVSMYVHAVAIWTYVATLYHVSMYMVRKYSDDDFI